MAWVTFDRLVLSQTSILAKSMDEDQVTPCHKYILHRFFIAVHDLAHIIRIFPGTDSEITSADADEGQANKAILSNISLAASLKRFLISSVSSAAF